MLAALRRFASAFHNPKIPAERKTEVQEICAALSPSVYRLVPTPVSFALAWPLPLEPRGFSIPGSSRSAEVERAVEEELSAIASRIGPEMAPPPAEAAPLAKHEHNRLVRTLAIHFWSWYGVPYRLLGDTMVRVGAPVEAFGPPVIETWKTDDFLVELASRSALDRHRIWQLTVQRNLWLAVTGGLILWLLK